MKYIFSLILCLLFILPADAQKAVKAGRTAFKSARTVSADAYAPFKNLKEVRAAAKRFSANSQSARLNAFTVWQTAFQAANAARQPKRDGHIFKAISKQDPEAQFSGTVFEVEYNGKKEIYGAIAAHTISVDEENPSLARNFIASVYVPSKRTMQKIPAEIVVFAPPNMLDLALVKFPKKAEKLLSPYPLGKITNEKTLHSIGYNHWGFSFIPDRHILKNTPYIIHTYMPLLHLERLGMCGSAVLNDKEELVGIHTGSRFDPFDPDAATYSYVVPADYLRSLVNAYHQGEKGTIPFYLSKDHTIALPPNEYIYSYELLDKHGKPLLGQTGFNYFSRSLFSTSLNAYPKSKFLRLKTKQLNWDSEGYLLLPGEVLFENSHKIYLYDLTKKEIVSVKQENWF